MKYGVIKNGKFEERELESISAKGFTDNMSGRVGTYDQYVMREINRSYGRLQVEGKVVLDIGANIGCFSRWALEHGAEHVIGLEPEQHNFDMLLLNCERYGNTTFHHRGLTADESGLGVLFLSPTGKNPGNSSMTERRGRDIQDIMVMSVEQLTEYHPNIDVAKIDCEGAEYEFMEYLIKSYPSLKQVALEIHISGFGVDTALRLHSFMLDMGFTPIVPPRIQENLWQTLATYVRD